jgi:hypothetical protein
VCLREGEKPLKCTCFVAVRRVLRRWREAVDSVAIIAREKRAGLVRDR